MKNKRAWHLWLLSGLMLFLYAMGIYDFFMMLSHNEAYYASHGYGQAVVQYFTQYPLYFMIFWITNLAAGFVAPILLLLRRRGAAFAALLSVCADALLLALTFAFRDRWAVLGSFVAGFDLFILAITFFFFLYCRHSLRQTAKSDG